MSLERLKEISQSMSNSLSVYALYREGKLKRDQTTENPPGSMHGNGIRAWPIFSDADWNITDSEYVAGAVWPDHVHPTSDELLVAVRGDFEVRIMHPEGEIQISLKHPGCLRVPRGVVHAVTAITAGRLAGICIPPEKAYDRQT